MSSTNSAEQLTTAFNAPVLVKPFEMLEVLRPLGPYGRMLDLWPRVPKAPDPEFLIRLFSGHVSHQAAIRQYAGSQYKNLENMIRGRHKVSSTTKQLMAGVLGWELDYLEELEGSAPDGPLLPTLLNLFHTLEGIAEQVMSGILDTEAICPCCGKNMLADVDVWWLKHAQDIKSTEYHFAERMLRMLSGAALLERLMFSFQVFPELALDNLCNLAAPARHPIGAWLLEAQTALSCDTLPMLVTKMQLQGREGTEFSYGRLKKWSAGQDLMPLEAGEAIAEATGQVRTIKWRLYAARCIALTTEFVAAVLPEGNNTKNRKHAQTIIHARLKKLNDNAALGMAINSAKVPRPSETG